MRWLVSSHPTPFFRILPQQISAIVWQICHCASYPNTHFCSMKKFHNGTIEKADFIKTVGLKLRTIRRQNKMTIEAAAFNADMDYTQLSRIELGKINTSFFQIYKISKSLNVHMFDILNDLP